MTGQARTVLKGKGGWVGLIIATTFAVYWPALKNGFVWDDAALVLRDPFIRSWLLIPTGFRHFLFTDATASNFYRPLQRLTYTFDYALYGFDKPWGFHLTNIVLHAAAASFLFLFARRFVARAGRPRAGSANFVAGFASLFWAVLPLHTSAVIYVAGRADLLAALFGFLALYLLETAREDRRPLSYFAAAACLLASMLSKESGIVFALVSLLFFDPKGGARLRWWILLLCAVFALYAALRFSAKEIPPPYKAPVPAAVRPILAARAWAEYAGLLIAPVNLHMERDLIPLNAGDMQETLRRARLREFQTLLGVALFAGFLAWCRWAWRTDPLVFRLLLAFFAAYLPISNLFSLNATAAEHWLYVPSAFLLLALFLALPIRREFLLVAILWLGFFGVRTFLRNADWRDDRRFFEKTIHDGGDSARMLTNLGSLESTRGHFQAALADFNQALTRPGDQPFARLGLAATYIRLRDFPRARSQLELVSQAPLFRAEYLQYLATIEYLEKNADRVDLLREAAKTGAWAAEKRYISHLDERGEKVAAIIELRNVLYREPYRAESWKMLGDLLEINRPDLAKAAFSQAAAYDVHDEHSRAEEARLEAASSR